MRAAFRSLGLETAAPPAPAEPVRPAPTFIAEADIDRILAGYVEPEPVTRRLFERFDIGRRGAFTAYDLRRVVLSLGLRPREAELRAMLAEVQSVASPYLSYQDFRRMREAGLGDEFFRTSLNVVVTFAKFNVSDLHRGRITADAVERALRQEGIAATSELCRAHIAFFMQCDSDGDGQVSFRDLYDAMTGRVPQLWLDWIFQQTHAGVPHSDIIEVLVQNGFDLALAEDIALRSASNPVPLSNRCFADTDVNHSYRIMV